jgi:hypothetical protein
MSTTTPQHDRNKTMARRTFGNDEAAARTFASGIEDRGGRVWDIGQTYMPHLKIEFQWAVEFDPADEEECFLVVNGLDLFFTGHFPGQKTAWTDDIAKAKKYTTRLAAKEIVDGSRAKSRVRSGLVRVVSYVVKNNEAVDWV